MDLEGLIESVTTYLTALASDSKTLGLVLLVGTLFLCLVIVGIVVLARSTHGYIKDKEDVQTSGTRVGKGVLFAVVLVLGVACVIAAYFALSRIATVISNTGNVILPGGGSPFPWQ
jgi:hypothetical protein